MSVLLHSVHVVKTLSCASNGTVRAKLVDYAYLGFSLSLTKSQLMINPVHSESNKSTQEAAAKFFREVCEPPLKLLSGQIADHALRKRKGGAVFIDDVTNRVANYTYSNLEGVSAVSSQSPLFTVVTALSFFMPFYVHTPLSFSASDSYDVPSTQQTETKLNPFNIT